MAWSPAKHFLYVKEKDNEAMKEKERIRWLRRNAEEKVKGIGDYVTKRPATQEKTMEGMECIAGCRTKSTKMCSGINREE